MNAMENGSEYGAWGSNVSTSSGDSTKRNAGMSLLGAVGSVGSAVGLTKRPARRGGKRPSIDNMEAMIRERPPFSSALHGQSSSKKLSPRSVAIPYSRVRKERFYDWPPDPTVSRATPLQVVGPRPVDPTNVLRQPEKIQEEQEEPLQVGRDEEDSIESFDEQMDRHFGDVEEFDFNAPSSDDGHEPAYEPVHHKAPPEPAYQPYDTRTAYEETPAYESAIDNQPLAMPIPKPSPPRHQTIDQQLRQRRFVEAEQEYDDTYKYDDDAYKAPAQDAYAVDNDAYMAEYESMGYG